MKYFVSVGEKTHEVELLERLGELLVCVDGEPVEGTLVPYAPEGATVTVDVEV